MEPTKMNYPSSIAVMTKVITPNAGNQALSTELFRLLKKTYPSARIYNGWRVPGLEQYTFSRLRRAGKDPLRTLDNWAESILNLYGSSNKASSPGQEELHRTLLKYKVSSNGNEPAYRIKLTPDKHVSLLYRIYSKVLRTLMAPFKRLRAYNKGYETWLRVLEHSDLIIYSPAGIMFDVSANYLVRDFLNLRIAQRLGAKVIAANQSIMVRNPLLLRLLGSVYSSLDAVVVRDPISRQCLIDIQVPQDKLKLAQDTAILADPKPLKQSELHRIAAIEAIEPGTVGIAVISLPWRNLDYYGWGEVISHLKSMGKNVLFVSNEMFYDAQVAKRFEELYGVKTITREYAYSEYIHFLSLLELVISERYHTCMFSAIANRPFIPVYVEKEVKMYGFAYCLDYSIPMVDSTHARWQDDVKKSVLNIYSHYEQIKTGLKESVARSRKLAEQNVLCDSTHDDMKT